MYRLDWDKAARIVRERALLDEKKEKLLRDEDDEENNSEDDDDDAESKSSSPMIIPPILSDAASSNFSHPYLNHLHRFVSKTTKNSVHVTLVKLLFVFYLNNNRTMIHK